MTLEQAKAAAGRKAAQLIESGMVVGLGTGTTAAYFIKELIQRCRDGLKIEAVASSHHSADLAKKGEIRIIDINSAPRIDITVDGADEVDPQKRMIKGAGGAHVREKILASSSGEMIVIIDSAKRVSALGKAKVPVEILFYGSPETRTKLEEAGLSGKWRTHPDGGFFITDNGNLIFDIFYESLVRDPEAEHRKIIQIPGVVDTGFFLGLAGRVIVGYPDGRTEIF